ncbi:aminoacyltransferase [Streptococcus porci]|uniref:aminoacyltransferase n=1 Tax=Streptococcus porci TaxID=502567 RepID=UPI00040B202C|nr:aminoacyltransferase [Streptococcus porci]
MALKILDQYRFQAFADSVAYKSFMQSVEMAELFQKRGYKTQFLGLEVEGQLKVAALLFSIPMAGGLHMEINSGPFSLDSSYLSDFYKALQTYAKENGALELIIKPYDTYQTFDGNGKPLDDERPYLIEDLTRLGFHHDGLLTGYPGGEPDWHYVKDLSGLKPDQLLSSFSKKGKPLVKKAQSFGIKLSKLDRSELSLFKTVTSATSDRRDYVDKPLDYYEQFYDSWGDRAEFMLASLNFQDYYDKLDQQQANLTLKIDKLKAELETNPNSEKKQNQLRELSSQAETFDVRKNEALSLINKHGQADVPLAASLFVYTKQEAIYLFSGSFPEFNKFYAPALLQDYVMKEALKRGISSYNLLGITGNFNQQDGVLRFKQNFNGYITRKMGTFRYYPKPLKYKALQTIKKILGR